MRCKEHNVDGRYVWPKRDELFWWEELKNAYVELQAENKKLREAIETTCKLIRDEGIVSKWKILNWLEQALKGQPNDNNTIT